MIKFQFNSVSSIHSMAAQKAQTTKTKWRSSRNLLSRKQNPQQSTWRINVFWLSRKQKPQWASNDILLARKQKPHNLHAQAVTFCFPESKNHNIYMQKQKQFVAREQIPQNLAHTIGNLHIRNVPNYRKKQKPQPPELVA